MTDARKEPPPGSELNPGLRQRREGAHDTTTPTPPPAESASVQREEGRAWPGIWLVVAIVCVLIALYLLFG